MRAATPKQFLLLTATGPLQTPKPTLANPGGGGGIQWHPVVKTYHLVEIVTLMFLTSSSFQRHGGDQS